MYIYINENEIIPYDGEILKRYVGKKLVKIIANPTNEDLREFGYMELMDCEVPEYYEKTQCLDITYKVENDVIVKVCSIVEKPTAEQYEMASE